MLGSFWLHRGEAGRSNILSILVRNRGASLTRRLAETDPDDQPHPHDFVRTLVVVSELVRPVRSMACTGKKVDMLSQLRVSSSDSLSKLKQREPKR